jgi:hypothetical protein
VSHCGAPLLIWFDGKHNKEHFAMRPYGLSTCSIDRRSVTPRRPQRDGQREPARRPSRPTRGRWPSVATRAAAVCLRPGFPFFLPRKPTGPTMRGMKLGQWASTGRALPERAFSREKLISYFLIPDFGTARSAGISRDGLQSVQPFANPGVIQPGRLWRELAPRKQTNNCDLYIVYAAATKKWRPIWPR